MSATHTIPTPPRSSTRHHSTDLLFREASRGDRAARETLTVHYMPLARKIARRYWNSSLPYEDLTQVANLALVQAIDRFDPDRGRPFEAFAIPTILGELRRYFRDSSWAVHVARGAQERSKTVQDAIELLSREHGRSPTVQQVALYLELLQRGRSGGAAGRPRLHRQLPGRARAERRGR